MSDLLRPLNDAQRQVVQTTHGPVLVLAGAGSGKTRALTHRIAYLLQQRIALPSEVLAVTFTNKAAAEMKNRVHQLLGSDKFAPRAIGTFHSLGARMLREAAAYHSRSQKFTILDTQDTLRIIRAALKEQGLSTREWNPRALQHRISTAKNTFLSLADIAAQVESFADEVFAKVYQRYEDLLAQHDAYDFDDLLRIPVKMLSEQITLRHSYQQRWRFLSVDEYQDTNPLQDALLKLLVELEQNICVVGDDYQAIYSWRGANVDHILKFEKDFPACQTIYLTQNYRSTPQILEAANHIIAANTAQKHKTLWTQQPSGNPPRVVALPSDRFEATWIRQCIAEYQQGGEHLEDCVILYRTNAQSRIFEEEFLTHNIPYTIVGGFRFYDRREVKDALAFLHLWVNPHARLSLDRIIESMVPRVGPKTVSRWDAKARQQNIPLWQYLAQEAARRPPVARILQGFEKTHQYEHQSVSELLQRLLEYTGYVDLLEAQPDGEERLQNIEELYNVTSVYMDPSVYLTEVSLLSDIDTLEERRDRITCMTLHAAKGLEYPVVFLVGCEEGLLPHLNSFDTEAAIEEERRLLYVGMTRAKKQLTLTYALQRYTHGEMAPQLPSRFLEQLPDSVERVQLPGEASVGVSPLRDYGLDAFYSEPQKAYDQDPILMSVSEGDFVIHPSFGRGVVIRIRSSALTCVFERHGVQTIDASTIQEH